MTAKPIESYANDDEVTARIIELLHRGEHVTAEEREELQDLAQALLIVAFARRGIDMDVAVDLIDRGCTLNIAYTADGRLEITQVNDDPAEVVL